MRYCWWCCWRRCGPCRLRELLLLRGRALEIVDDKGKLRASISVLPPNERTGDMAILRLMDPVSGRPSVKLSTSENGSGLMLLGGAQTRGTWVSLTSPLKTMNTSAMSSIATHDVTNGRSKTRVAAERCNRST